jgi:ABC-2 type transport system ATP-binding protein
MTSRLALSTAALATALIGSLAAGSLAAGPVAAGPIATGAAAKAPAVTITDGCLLSVPDPGTSAKVKICYTLFKPASATRKRKAPMLLHSHGWGGSRTTEVEELEKYLAAGYGVLSFDQRGFGESGGRAQVMNADVEGHDVRALVRLVAKLRWVQQDRPGDPRLGAIGGSYGGGYQFLGAFETLRVKGRNIFDAIAPQITWHDLSESLAPEGVVRTEWALALSAAGLPTDALPLKIYKALLEGAVTGTWPDGSVPGTENLNAFFKKNGPRWHVRQGRRLSIPVLFGQGMTDTLFNSQQGLSNWRKALAPKARKRSIYVGYNGGHTLPAVYPLGVNVAGDPCSKKLAGGDFVDLSIRFFDEQLRGRKTGLRGYDHLHFATRGLGCVTVHNAQPNTKIRLGTITAPTGPAAPALATKIAEGPITIAGSSYLTADVTTQGAEARQFFGLAVGTSPLDASLVQNNVLPWREAVPVSGKKRRITIPSVSVQVPRGQSLYLIASATSETFLTMSSRLPGMMRLANTVVHLPVRR